jgi:hypothetical protein
MSCCHDVCARRLLTCCASLARCRCCDGACQLAGDAVPADEGSGAQEGGQDRRGLSITPGAADFM